MAMVMGWAKRSLSQACDHGRCWRCANGCRLPLHMQTSTKVARTMPMDTGVALTSNEAAIAKVKVTGGVGFEVRSPSAALLYPPVAVKDAARAFLNEAHVTGKDHKDKYRPTIHHVNGIAIHSFEWNCNKARHEAMQVVVKTLLCPPLCAATSLQSSSMSLDAREGDGWSLTPGVLHSMLEDDGTVPRPDDEED